MQVQPRSGATCQMEDCNQSRVPYTFYSHPCLFKRTEQTEKIQLFLKDTLLGVQKPRRPDVRAEQRYLTLAWAAPRDVEGTQVHLAL